MTSLLRRPTLVAALLACSACEAYLEPIAVAPGCPNQPLREPERWAGGASELLIDDFEDGDVQLRRVAGRDGAWILGRDDTAGDLTAEASDRCAARGTGVGHFAGSGFLDWGANWTAVFKRTVNGEAAPYDVSQYTAISFWAAVSGDAKRNLDLPVGLTTMDVAWNGGICSECMDYYRTQVELTPTWKRYVVPFSDLRQLGNGVPQIALRADQTVGFIIWPDREFEVWLDDVRFER